MRPAPLTITAFTAVLTLTAPAHAQPVADHLKCYKVKDSAPKAVYTADLGGLVAEPQCTIKVPGSLLCVEATKTNVNPTPPGGADNSGSAGRFMCYKVKCPKATLPQVQWHDQFGDRVVSPGVPKILCAPEIVATTTTTTAPPTTTTTTTTTSTTTTTTVACGNVGQPCCGGNTCTGPVPNGMAGCVGGTCGIGSCNAGFADCDGNPADGCETNVATNVSNCGACGNVCSTNHDTPSCVGGACQLTCNAGFADCDHNPADGCETNVNTSSSNCGSCGTVCTAGPNAGGVTCTAGMCQVTTCNTCFADCDHFAADGCEVDVCTSPNNCGSCGTVCNLANTSGDTCVGGACQIGSCNAGFADCDHNPADGCETNVNTSSSNCGSCGTVCPPTTPTCSGGTCH